MAIRVSTLLLSFASRTVFIYVLGAEYLGLNGLFTNILSFLALSELGLGSAIAFLLYKPIAENDEERMKAVMQFYKKCYWRQINRWQARELAFYTVLQDCVIGRPND